MKRMRFLLVLPALLLSNANFAQNKSDMPEPVVRIGAISGGAATVQQVLDNPRVVVLDPVSVITDFKFHYALDGGKISDGIFTKGTKFTDEEISKIREMKNGRIVIDEIHIRRGPNQMTPKSLTLRITDK